MADPDPPAADSLLDSLDLGNAGEQRLDNVPSLSAGHSSSQAIRQASSSQVRISVGRPFFPALRVPEFGGSSATIGRLQAGGFLGISHASRSQATRQASLSQAQISMGWGCSPALQTFDSGGGFRGNSRASSSRGPLPQLQVLPFPNTSSGLSFGSADQRSVSLGWVRERVLRGPIHPQLAKAPDLSDPLLGLLDDGDSRVTENILRGVLSSVFGVMKNQYGRHLFQKLLDVCSDVQKKEIVFAVTTSSDPLELVKVAKDKHGIFCVEGLITAMKPWPRLCSFITRALNYGIVEIMSDPTAFLLVKHCFRHLGPYQNSFLIQAAITYWYLLAKDRFGVLSVQLCIENSLEPLRQQVLEKIANNTLELAQDKNYAVQSVLTLEYQYATKMICTLVADHLAALSVDKHSTFVIERCLQSSAGECLLQELASFDGRQLERIARDRYGNYVLKTALDVKKDMRLHSRLVCAIMKISHNLNGNMYASNILKCIKQHL